MCFGRPRAGGRERRKASGGHKEREGGRERAREEVQSEYFRWETFFATAPPPSSALEEQQVENGICNECEEFTPFSVSPFEVLN